MDYLKFNYNICRICLDQNVILNWNESITEFDHETYKDCYYKYTQLEISVEDPFTQMLCQSCVNDLETSHILITKALESHVILQQTYIDNQISNENEEFKSLGDQISKYKTNEFEMLILPNNEEPSIRNNEDEKDYNTVQVKTERRAGEKSIERDIFKDKFVQSSSVVKEEFVKEKELKKSKSLKNCNTNTSKNSGTTHKRHVKMQNIKSSKNENDESQGINTSECTKASKKKLLCSICSKICGTKGSLKIHEDSHRKHRERSEICPYCGIKFFNKACLKIHLKTHNKNRKKYNCEYCDKSYLDRGTLNVHRRVHLGQMIPCSICSKEFYRQSELDRHNTVAHSAAPINADIKERSKYYVFCKYCNKQMLSTSFKAHQANHEKEPLMKCSLCDKDFFSRTTYHMQKIHNYKAREEYEQFIIYYKTNRLSHLLLKQHDIIAT